MTAVAPPQELIAGDDLKIDFVWRQENAEGPLVNLTGFEVVASLHQFGNYFEPGQVQTIPLEGRIIARWSEAQTQGRIVSPDTLEARIRVTDTAGDTETLLIVPILWRR